MNKEINIKEYRPEEELQWLDLHASVMVDSYAWWIVNHKKPVYKNEVIDLVAVHNDRLVGFTVAEINAEFADKNTAFVWDFGVHRDYRGKNIGRKMIEHLHKIMNEKYGINKSIWYSQDPNSIKYYAHFGMKEIGRHWQLSIELTKEQNAFFRKDKFYCQTIRGTCGIDELDEVRKKFKPLDNDDTLKPMVCVGYEFIM